MKRTTLWTRSFALPIVGLALAIFAFAGCDSAGPTDSSVEEGNVEVGFQTSYSSSKSTPASKSAPDSLVISGSNGTLVIQDVRLIVSGLELEGEADSAEFEAAPSFLDLPLDTNQIAPVAASKLPAATYDEFEFNVEDVDFGEAEDEDEDEEALRALRDTIRQVFPNWPDKASMVAVGTFTPSGDTTRSFTTYFEAEIEVEREFSQPLEVTSDGFSRSLTVTLDPTRWFKNTDGTTQNLAESDYSSTGELVEFEAEFEDGVTEIESEEDEDEREEEDDDNEDDDSDDGSEEDDEGDDD